MVIRLFFVFLIGLAGYLSYHVYTLYDARSHISNIPAGQYFGPDDADVTLVEFLDYSCGYCQEVHPAVMEAVKVDGNVKYAPLPVMSQNADGTSAAYVLYAAARLGKFEQAHEYLMKSGTNLVPDRIPEIAADLGLDPDEFHESLGNREVIDRVKDNTKVTITLGNLGTPTFFLGPDIRYIPQDGLPSVEDFQKLFAEARASQ